MRRAVRRRPMAVGAAVAVAVLAALGGTPSPVADGAARVPGAVVAGVSLGRAQEWGTAEEQAFVAKINQLRTDRGLAALAVDVELTNESRVWSETMKQAGNIFHTTNLAGGITSDWGKLGENVGVGGTVDALFDAFVASPKHYENLVDPVFRFVGVGVVWDGSRMFTTHRFMSLRPPPPTTAAPTTAAAAPTPAATQPGAAAQPPSGLPATAPTTPDEPTPPAPTELAAVDPAAAPSSPTPPPASPTRIALILRTVDDLFS